jgi:hypothetical protein
MHGVRTLATVFAVAATFYASSLQAQNVAQGKTASQSSTWSSTTPASNAVDGNLSTMSHTSSELNAWWMVDLGGVFNISEISIWNRQEQAWASRLYPYRISVQDVFNAALTSANDVWTVDVTSAQGTSVSTPDVFFPPAGVAGRFVKVQLLGTNWLHLAEVEVAGTQAPGTVVPEPMSMALLGTGLVGLYGARRRRKLPIDDGGTA